MLLNYQAIFSVLLHFVASLQLNCAMIPLDDAELTPDLSVYEIEKRTCHTTSRNGDSASIKLSAFSPGDLQHWV